MHLIANILVFVLLILLALWTWLNYDIGPATWPYYKSKTQLKQLKMVKMRDVGLYLQGLGIGLALLQGLLTYDPAIGPFTEPSVVMWLLWAIAAVAMATGFALDKRAMALSRRFSHV
jgi:hypothetical protein